MENISFFEKTPPLKLFFKAAIPGSIGMLASAIYLFLDGVIISRLLGEIAFAAFNMTIPIVVLNFGISDLIGIGSSVSIAILLGEKRFEKASKLFSLSCFIIFISSTLSGVILFFFAPNILHLLGATGELARQSIKYLRVYALFSPLTTCIFAVDNYLRICGKIKFSMFLNIFMSFLCISLEILFLYFFKFELIGAALANCIAFFICTLIAFSQFFKNDSSLKFCNFKIEYTYLKSIFTNGMPTFLNNVASRITNILFNYLLLYLGGVSAVSIYGILMCIEAFILPVLYGMCDALQPALGYNWGAKNYSRVKVIEKYCLIASAITSIVTSSIILLFTEEIASLFIPQRDDTFTLAIPALIIFATTYLTRWLSFAIQSFMSAIGKFHSATLISLCVTFIFPILSIPLLWRLKLTGLWWNSSITSILTGILSLFLLKKLLKSFKLKN